MSAHRAREPRQPVRIGARLRSARGWSDVVIRNVSAGGVMGECAAPPVRGAYVEVRCGAYVIVGRVAWSEDACSGALAQDRIEVPDLLADADGRASAARERRKLPRAEHVAPRRPSLAERAAASGRTSRALDFTAAALAGAALATLAAGSAHHALAQPMDKVGRNLAVESGR